MTRDRVTEAAEHTGAKRFGLRQPAAALWGPQPAAGGAEQWSAQFLSGSARLMGFPPPHRGLCGPRPPRTQQAATPAKAAAGCRSPKRFAPRYPFFASFAH